MYTSQQCCPKAIIQVQFVDQNWQKKYGKKKQLAKECGQTDTGSIIL